MPIFRLLPVKSDGEVYSKGASIDIYFNLDCISSVGPVGDNSGIVVDGTLFEIGLSHQALLK